MPRIRAFNRRQYHRGNRYSVKNASSMETPPPCSHTVKSTPPSSSKRKLNFSVDETTNPQLLSNDSCMNIICDINVLSDFVRKNVMCKYCNNTNCVFNSRQYMQERYCQ